MVRARGLAVALVSGIVLLAALPGPAQAERAAGTPRQEAIAAKLDNIKISLDFHDAALPDVLDFVRSFSGIDFMLDPAVRERHGGDPIKVTMKVNDLPLRSALRLMLHGQGLTAVCREGVLVVVPKEQAEKEVVLRIYDVRDLMMKLGDHPGPTIALRPPAEGSGIVIGPLGDLSDPPKEDFVLEMIRKNCGGTSWAENPNASITFNNGLLMVNQTPRVHAEVARMISKLRQYR